MHIDNPAAWTHEHVFDVGSAAAERGTRLVMWITAAMMVIEILAGWWFNSMALLADGWHMSSHAVAIGLSAFAYAAARRYARDARFAFGSWKIEILGGFASAIFLIGVALTMVVGSVERLFTPEAIQYQEAMVIAVLGLAVNLLCAWILGEAHDHGHAHHHPEPHPHPHAQAHEPGLEQHHHSHVHNHEHDSDRHPHPHPQDHDQGHRPHYHDLNLRSAYIHVIADAATSVLAILALGGGMIYGWAWLDPVMGIVGALLVGNWAKGLLMDTGKVLLDREMDHPVVDEIREVVETGPEGGDTRIMDLHVWRVGKNAYSCALMVVTHDPALSADLIRQRLAVHEEIVHTTIEVHHCPDVEPHPGLVAG